MAKVEGTVYRSGKKCHTLLEAKAIAVSFILFDTLGTRPRDRCYVGFTSGLLRLTAQLSITGTF